MSLRLWVVAGPNGAGKSTLVDRYLRSGLPVVNPDVIAAQDGVAPLEAGRRAILERRNRLAERRSFLIETTLTGRGEIGFVEEAARQGYRITLFFVGINSVQTSVGRVRVRVAAGGHDVPIDDLFRRFDRSLANLREILAGTDRAYLIDNSAKQRRLVRTLRAGNSRWRSDNLPAWADF